MLRADGEDAIVAVKLIDELRVAHRLIGEQQATEGAIVNRGIATA
jgi:hypothetical protein